MPGKEFQRGLCAARLRLCTFQVTAHIGLLKEGGKVKSYHQNCPGHARTGVKEVVFIGRFVEGL